MVTLSPFFTPKDFNPLENLHTSVRSSRYVIFLELEGSSPSQITAILSAFFSICRSRQLYDALSSPSSYHLIEKLSLLLNDKQKRENMGNAGRKFVEENFNWNKITQKFINDLENLLYTKRKDVNS